METYRSVPYDLVGNFVVLQRPPDLHTTVKSCQAKCAKMCHGVSNHTESQPGWTMGFRLLLTSGVAQRS